MKKIIILFAVSFVVLSVFFSMDEIEHVNQHAAITKSTGFAAATPEGITKITRKRSVNYQVNYVYEVAGTSYKIDSGKTSEENAKAMVMKAEQVAYDTKAPSNAMLKSDFEHLDKNEGLLSAIMTALGMGLLGAVAISAIAYWKFNWFRR